MPPMLQPLSPQATKLSVGIYEHYKGNRYKIIAVGRHSETLEEIVIYQSLYGSGDFWVRPLNSFLETITLPQGQQVLRFKLIQPL